MFLSGMVLEVEYEGAVQLRGVLGVRGYRYGGRTGIHGGEFTGAALYGYLHV
jgi:hypothetical protein